MEVIIKLWVIPEVATENVLYEKVFLEISQNF